MKSNKKGYLEEGRRRKRIVQNKKQRIFRIFKNQRDKRMVFHYTNFVVETNAWWLRRVRPVS